MRPSVRLSLASLLTCALGLSLFGRATAVHARPAALRVVWGQGTPRLLNPGSHFQVEVQGLPAAPREGYCLGMASLGDRYGVPVTLGALGPRGAGQLAVRATVPARVFPTEPAGPFLLFVGRCTDVAPDGIYASTQVTIMPAAR